MHMPVPVQWPTTNDKKWISKSQKIIADDVRITLRSAEGFASSIFTMMKLHLPIPCYTTLSRRAGKHSVPIRKHAKTGEALHVVIDSTGMKIYPHVQQRLFSLCFMTVTVNSHNF